MDRVNRNFSVNAGRGSYKAAKEAAELIQCTKSNIVKLFQCDGLADVVFSPSVTLAMNQIIKGLNIDSNTVIYISPYEHNAVARTIEAVRAKTECEICFLPLDDLTLEIDLKKMEYLFHEKKPDIVISTVISNVTGYRIPVEKIFEVAQSYSSITIADAAQAAGLIDIDYKTFHADIIAFAGHKTLCGPFGIGGFVIRKDLTLDQVLTGGTGSDSLNLKMPEESPNRYEAGSKNIVAIAGLKAALNWLEKNPHRVKIQELTEYLINKMLVIVSILELAKQYRELESKDTEYGMENAILGLPLVLDGPFSALSNENTTLVANRLPQFAEQVIIFMLDKDWEASGLEKFTLSEYCYRVNKEASSNSSTLEKN